MAKNQLKKAAPAEAIVAGHICLDIIPAFKSRVALPQDFFVPGDLVKIGPAVVATGGAVSNTGLALHRLGVPTRLMGKVGDDLFGRAIVDIVRGVAPELAAGMIVAAVSTDRWWWTIAAILLTGNALWALELHERQAQRPA